jgi:hypothetical protein
MKFITEDKNAQLDDLLNRVCENLQLSPSKREKVENRYKGVCEWIESDNGIFNKAKIYPQGSYRIGTTILPVKDGEFDLDFVVQIDADWESMKFIEIYKKFKDRLVENPNYKPMIEEKSRCIRIKYASEFHMDIIPCCTENKTPDKNRIMVPDKIERDWVISNPEGYANWFENKYIREEEIFLKGFSDYGQILEKAEELPQEVPFQLKQPLQRAVQLIKRHRDIYFLNQQDYSPSSIVLTTIAGHFYKGEKSIFEALDSIINGILDFYNKNAYKSKLKVLNPVNESEDFTKEWEDNHELYKKFIEYIISLNEVWKKLNSLVQPQLTEYLKKAFGEKPITEAFLSQGNYLNKKRYLNEAAITKATGTIAAASSLDSVKDKPNLFHG